MQNQIDHGAVRDLTALREQCRLIRQALTRGRVHHCGRAMHYGLGPRGPPFAEHGSFLAGGKTQGRLGSFVKHYGVSQCVCWQGRIQGVRTPPPFWGTPKLHKEGKNRKRRI